jgi:hypothetical protein
MSMKIGLWVVSRRALPTRKTLLPTSTFYYWARSESVSRQRLQIETVSLLSKQSESVSPQVSNILAGVTISATKPESVTLEPNKPNQCHPVPTKTKPVSPGPIQSESVSPRASTNRIGVTRAYANRIRVTVGRYKSNQSHPSSAK